MSEFRHKKTEFGWGWREKVAKGKRKGVLQRSVGIEVSPDDSASIEEYIAQIREVAATLEEPSIGMDLEYGAYGDRDRDVVKVSGWRDATEQEIADMQQKAIERAELARKHEEAQIEYLRKQRPDLFTSTVETDYEEGDPGADNPPV